MNTAKRIISGSIASWLTMLASFASQLILVPFYLAYWDATAYGTWIVLQAMFGISQILDKGHSKFLWNEFLRYTARRRSLVRRTLWSGVCVGIMLGAAQFFSVIAICYFDILDWFIIGNSEKTANLLDNCKLLLIMNSFSWWLFGSSGGVLVMAVLPFGYYARNAWWGLFTSIATTLSPLPALINGGGVLEVGLSVIACTVVCNIPFMFSLLRVCAQERLLPIRPSSKLMVRNFLLSLVMSLQSFLDFFRQQGIRIVLAPLSGTVAITGFTTMRTGANIALQGLQTLSSPIQPELMRFWGERDQQRVDSCLCLIWSGVLLVMIPAGLVLQLFVRPLFELWTRGRVAFDPVLFSMLSVGVLLYGVSQPSLSIVQGANRLRSQLIIASVSAAAGLLLMVFLVPLLGIRGAGVSLLVSESVALACYAIAADHTLRITGVKWPWKIFNSSLIAILLASVGVLAQGAFESLGLFICTGSVLIWIVSVVYFWLAIPTLVRSWAVNVFSDILGRRLG